MRVVVATDGSMHSKAAIDLLFRLPLTGSQFRLITVVETPMPVFAGDLLIAAQVDESLLQMREKLSREAMLMLDREKRRFSEKGLAAKAVLADGHVADQIIQACVRPRADLLVVGSRGLGKLRGLLLGSVSHQLVKHAPCSVLVSKATAAVTRGRRNSTGLRILIGFDGSADSNAAVSHLAALPLHKRVEVVLLTIMPSLPEGLNREAVDTLAERWEEERRATEASLEKARKRIASAGASVSLRTANGAPGPEILKVARSLDTDIIMVGATGRSAIDKFLLGSVADHLLSRSQTKAVWIVRSRA